jgi:CRP-like cAMP-binding protein
MAMFTTVEKVLLLQEVDILKESSTEDLAYIAAITEEVFFQAGESIYKEGEAADCMYVVNMGQVKLHKDGREVMIAGAKDAFGTWALFDDEPRITSATTLEDTNLLRIDRDEFYELLADHTQITQNVLKTLSTRLRNLIQRVRIGPEPGK